MRVITVDGGMVNAYLLEESGRFALVDALTANKRADLEAAMADAGCAPGDLALIVVTHGDPDHIGSCAYLRERFKAPIAMHSAEVPVTQGGDMRGARPNTQGFSKFVFAFLSRVFRVASEDRFAPDIVIGDELDLSPYGFDARVLSTPGHSLGSVTVLTAQGDAICGDLMQNRGKPAANSLVDDPAAMAQSIQRLRELGAVTVYPGHGKPFPLADVV
jgi:glyoxylase-like metal-dependent hydrolase (beta-lactamase superfamily II)